MINQSVNPEMSIDVYKKKNKKVFCKIKIDEEHLYVFDELQETLNSTTRYVKLTDNIIIDKTEIDYIILNN